MFHKYMVIYIYTLINMDITNNKMTMSVDSAICFMIHFCKQVNFRNKKP